MLFHDLGACVRKCCACARTLLSDFWANSARVLSLHDDMGDESQWQIVIMQLEPGFWEVAWAGVTVVHWSR